MLEFFDLEMARKKNYEKSPPPQKKRGKIAKGKEILGKIEKTFAERR